MRTGREQSASPGRLLAGLALTALLLAPFTFIVYGADVAQSVAAVGGLGLLLALALGVAWASARKACR